MAGLLGVLGASMSGPGLHPRPKGADALSASASPKQRFTLREKRSLPRHLRIWPTDAQKRLDDRRMFSALYCLYDKSFYNVKKGIIFFF
jgi:hypothetical protein